MAALITGKLSNVHQIKSLKYLTHGIYFNHWSNTKNNPNQITNIANTYCLI